MDKPYSCIVHIYVMLLVWCKGLHSSYLYTHTGVGSYYIYLFRFFRYLLIKDVRRAHALLLAFQA